EREIAAQRGFDDTRALHACARRVHSECRRGNQDRIAARRAKRTHQQVDAFIAAAPDQQSIGLDAIQFGEAGTQRRGLRIRIAVPTVLTTLRRPGRLVGVQPDVAAMRLHARGGIRLQGPDFRSCKLDGIHATDLPATKALSSSTDSRVVMARRCASSPSAAANVAAHGPTARSASGAHVCTVTCFWKLATDTPLQLRAQPCVGNTWLLPLQ